MSNIKSLTHLRPVLETTQVQNWEFIVNCSSFSISSEKGHLKTEKLLDWKVSTLHSWPHRGPLWISNPSLDSILDRWTSSKQLFRTFEALKGGKPQTQENHSPYSSHRWAQALTLPTLMSHLLPQGGPSVQLPALSHITSEWQDIT